MRVESRASSESTGQDLSYFSIPIPTYPAPLSTGPADDISPPLAARFPTSEPLRRHVLPWLLPFKISFQGFRSLHRTLVIGYVLSLSGVWCLRAVTFSASPDGPKIPQIIRSRLPSWNDICTLWISSPQHVYHCLRMPKSSRSRIPLIGALGRVLHAPSMHFRHVANVDITVCAEAGRTSVAFPENISQIGLRVTLSSDASGGDWHWDWY